MAPIISTITPVALLITNLAALAALAEDCTASTFGVLATSPTVSLCMKDSNIPLLTMGTAPTPEQLSVVCKTPTCRELLRLLVDLNAQECTIPLAGRLRLHADLIDPAVAYCKEAGLPLTSDTSASSQEETSGSLHDTASMNATTTNETTQVPAPASVASQITVAHSVVVLFLVMGSFVL